MNKIKIMEPGNFKPDDSIKTIEDALKQAKSEKTGAAFYYLLWGAILFIHYSLLFIIIRFHLKGNLLEMTTWSVFPIGGFISYLRSKNDTQKEKMLSYNEKIYLYGFGAFALAYGTVFTATVFVGSNLSTILYPLLLGFTVFVIGGITKHKPSFIGGVLSIICTGISLHASMEVQYLLAALSSLIACLIPGFLMKNSNV